MAQTMRKVKGKRERVRETGRQSRFRDVECGTTPPSQEHLDDDLETLVMWMRGETRVTLDESEGLGAE